MTREELLAFLEWISRFGGEARLMFDDRAGNVHDMVREEAGILVDAYLAHRARSEVTKYFGQWPAIPEPAASNGHSTTIEGIMLCTVQPLTPEERSAIGAYFRLMRAEGKSPLGGS